MTHLARVLLLALLAPVSAGDAAPTAPVCASIDGDASLYGAGRVLLLGELHGTRESPAFAGSAVCRAASRDLAVVLGLELSGSDRERLARYLASAGDASDRIALIEGTQWQRDYQDGRTSRAMVALIDQVRQLRHDGRRVDIVLFDAPTAGGGAQRDRAMAANLLRSVETHPDAMHIVLTGNLHSRIEPGFRGDPAYEPMGYAILRALGRSRVTALDVAYEGGTAWICAPDCGEAKLAGREGGAPAGTIEIDADSRPAGHDGRYFVGTITASPPARQSP